MQGYVRNKGFHAVDDVTSVRKGGRIGGREGGRREREEEREGAREEESQGGGDREQERREDLSTPCPLG
jgi:hypothetical protein